MTVESNKEIRVQGIPICRGIGIGRPFFFKVEEEKVPEISIESSEIEQEVSRFQSAVRMGQDAIRELQSRLRRESIAVGEAILDAQLQLMSDPILTSYVEERIRKTSKNAEHVFQSVIMECQRKFDLVSDPFFQERYKDIQEISRRILGHLRGGMPRGLSDIPWQSIIFAEELTAIDTATARQAHIAAFVTKTGGATSHAAIVAKAKGIPYVTSIDLAGINIQDHDWIIVDGRSGMVIINPSLETLKQYQRLSNQLEKHMRMLLEKGKLEAETIDGYCVQLSANIEMTGDLDILGDYAIGGVGLLRTESPFLSREAFPTEEEQFDLYRQCVEKMDGAPIVIRTFDVGGDKNLASNYLAEEINPYLGCRAIRFLLQEREIFKEQLRAILRASIFGNVRILFPMVSSLQELLDAKAVLQEVRDELNKNGIPFMHSIPVGCMIEVPSAAIIADLLAEECDFLSIGTNDLVQYTLAVDRSNDALSHLYAPTHPSILRMIRLIVSEANHHGIPVAVCGEVAADPRFAPLLLGLGVHELSVSSRYLPLIKNAIRHTTIVGACRLAEKALALSTADEIEDLITNEYRRIVPEDCFYNL